MMQTIIRNCLAVILLLTITECVDSGVPGPIAVRVKILDAWSGKPLAGIRTALGMYDGTLTRGIRDGTTDSEGIATFDLPDKVSTQIGPVFAPDYDYAANCSEVAFLTAQVLDTGMVGKNYCNSSMSRDSIIAKPGELVIFAKRISPWRRFLRELF
jgi:hypothetical protein